MKISPIFAYVNKINNFSFKTVFKGGNATEKDSRLDFYESSKLASDERNITKIDSKVLIGRAPGKPRYSRSKGYLFDNETLESDVKFLKNLGVDTIVDLRNPKYESEECIKKEGEVCRKNSVNYLNIPLDSAIAPTDDELKKFFNAVYNLDEGKKIYIHCHAGKDRTGIITSCYLAKEHKMTKEEAFQTVFDNRMDSETGYKKPIKRLLFMSGSKAKEQRYILYDKLAKLRSGELKF